MHEPEADHGARVCAAGGRSRPRSARARRSRRRPCARTAPGCAATARTPRRRSSRRPRRPARPPLASRIAAPRSSARESTVASAPSRVGERALLLGRGERDHPRRRRASRAGRRACRCRPRRASTTTVSPGSRRAQRWTSACAVRPWSSSEAAWSSETSSGTGTSHARGRRPSPRSRRSARIAATRRPSGVRAGDLAAGRQRQGLLGEVVVAGRVGVGEVDPAARDVDDDLAVAGLGVGQLDELHHLGAAELLDLDRLQSASLRRGSRFPLVCRTRVPDRRRLDRVRQRPHPVRGARAHARRLGRALRARRQLLHRGPRRRARSATTSATSSSRCSPSAAIDTDDIERVAGRRDVLLARPLRPRHERRPHRRHAAQRVRRVRAEALRRPRARRRCSSSATSSPTSSATSAASPRRASPRSTR